MKYFVVLVFVNFLTTIFSQSVSMVRDINNALENDGSEPKKIGEINNLLVFSAVRENTGRELYIMDQNENISLLMDINPGTADSYPINLLPVGELYQGKLLFSAGYGVNGFTNRGLWMYDGVNPPTLLSDITTPNGLITPTYGIVFNDAVYFEGNKQSTGMELWKYDGISEPFLFAELKPGIYGSNPGKFIVYNDSLYFTADDGMSGVELWKYNGIDWPEVVEDINTSSNLHSYPDFLTIYDDKLYFAATDTIYGRELWMHDGSSTSLVQDIYPGVLDSEPKNFKIYDNHLFMAAKGPGIGQEIFRFDGNSASVISNGLQGASNLLAATEFNGVLYFMSTDTAHGNELWKLASAFDTPQLVIDIAPGNEDSGIESFFELNSQLYFYAYTNLVYSEFWSIDINGTPHQLTNLGQNQHIGVHATPLIFNNTFYFSGDDGNIGFELWKIVGYTAQLVSDINNTTQSSAPNNLVEFQSNLFLTASTVSNGLEIWSNRLNSLFDIEFESISGPSTMIPHSLINVNSQLYYSANDGLTGIELWTYNPALSTVQQLTDINPNGGSVSGQLFSFDNRLFFSGADGTSNNNNELFEYNIASDLSQLVMNINPGTSASVPNHFCVFNNKMYFSARTNLHGRELWVYDGVNLPEEVADIIPFNVGSDPQDIVVFNDAIYFSANSGSFGSELMVYNEINPPSIVSDINTAGSSQPRGLFVFNDKLFFTANDGVSGREIWVYDGVNPPSLLIDLYPGSSDGVLVNPYFTPSQNILFFIGNDGIHGSELWAYDGTNPPYLVKDIYPGIDHSNSRFLTAVDENIYFESNEGLHGFELWRLCWNPSYDTIDVQVDCEYIAANGSVYFESGEYDITITNHQNCDSNIHVNLTILPDLIAPVVGTIDTSFIDCGDLAYYEIPTFSFISDNCTKFNVNLESVSSDNGFNPETITRQYKIIDQAGNFVYQEHIIVIHDTTPPEIGPQDTVYLTCASDIPEADTFLLQNISDNCGIAGITHTQDEITQTNLIDTLIRLYEVMDLAGNISIGQIVYVIYKNQFDLQLVNDTIFCSEQNGVNYTWINCLDNSILQDESNYYFQPQFPGSYAVIVDFNNCIDTSACLEYQTTSVVYLKKQSYSIIPNPAENFIQIIGIENKESSNRIQILDINGKVVYCRNLDLEFIDIAHLTPGCYFVEIIGSEHSERLKFIKI